MRPIDVPQSAILAALDALKDLAEAEGYRSVRGIEEHHAAAMIAAAITGTDAEAAAEDRAIWQATWRAQREHSEIAIPAILRQTDLIQQIVDKVLGIGNAPTEYEVWRDALTLAVSERSYIDADGISSSGLLVRAGWFHKQLKLGSRSYQAVEVEQQRMRDLGAEAGRLDAEADAQGATR